MNSKKERTGPERWRAWLARWSPRGMVLTVLGALTLGVAGLSVAVSYQILTPAFGLWAAPTVGALDILWVVLQATELLAGNNRSRATHVQRAGLALTAVIAAIPTADLIISHHGGGSAGLAVVLAPAAIVATKGTWWLVLPALGRRVSPATRQAIATRRQEVADRIEVMAADAADRIELLNVAATIKEQVGAAETDYRVQLLAAQQSMTERLHAQARQTIESVTARPLPPVATDIDLPDLETWSLEGPALPVTAVRAAVTTGGADRHTPGTQVNGLTGPEDVTSRGAALTLADMAAVAGVPTPPVGEPLTDSQIGVVLRYLRYQEDPPLSKRQATKLFRNRGYVGSQERLKRVWRAEVSTDEDTGTDDDDVAEDVDDVADDDVTS